MRFFERSVQFNAVTRELEAGPIFVRFGRDTGHWRWISLQIRIPPKRFYCGIGFEKDGNLVTIGWNRPRIEFYKSRASDRG